MGRVLADKLRLPVRWRARWLAGPRMEVTTAGGVKLVLATLEHEPAGWHVVIHRPDGSSSRIGSPASRLREAEDKAERFYCVHPIGKGYINQLKERHSN